MLAEGRSAVRRPYRALDPELLLWVHATLVDSALATYERFVASIGPVARDRYHEEMKRQAMAFAVGANATSTTPAGTAAKNAAWWSHGVSASAAPRLVRSGRPFGLEQL